MRRRCGRSSAAEHQLPKLRTRVRFPSPALSTFIHRARRYATAAARLCVVNGHSVKRLPRLSEMASERKATGDRWRHMYLCTVHGAAPTRSGPYVGSSMRLDTMCSLPRGYGSWRACPPPQSAGQSRHPHQGCRQRRRVRGPLRHRFARLLIWRRRRGRRAGVPRVSG